jgi:hypothetical protein
MLGFSASDGQEMWTLMSLQGLCNLFIKVLGKLFQALMNYLPFFPMTGLGRLWVPWIMKVTALPPVSVPHAHQGHAHIALTFFPPHTSYGMFKGSAQWLKGQIKLFKGARDSCTRSHEDGRQSMNLGAVLSWVISKDQRWGTCAKPTSLNFHFFLHKMLGNKIYLTALLWGLNKIMHRKLPAHR